jgi:hypothetical protein
MEQSEEDWAGQGGSEKRSGKGIRGRKRKKRPQTRDFVKRETCIEDISKA